jgi:hypothetical protein
MYLSSVIDIQTIMKEYITGTAITEEKERSPKSA